MTEIVFYKEGSGWVVDRPKSHGSAILGRGRTKAEALGTLLLATMGAEEHERILSEIVLVGEYNSFEEYAQSRLEKIGTDDDVPMEGEN